MAAPTTTGRHQAWPANIPIPPAARSTAARSMAMLAKFRSAASPSNFEIAQDFKGQVMPGFSSKKPALCPKYNPWTTPCSKMKMPNITFTMESLHPRKCNLEED